MDTNQRRISSTTPNSTPNSNSKESRYHLGSSFKVLDSSISIAIFIPVALLIFILFVDGIIIFYPHLPYDLSSLPKVKWALLGTNVFSILLALFLSKRLKHRFSEKYKKNVLIQTQLQESRESLDFALQSGNMGTWEIDLKNWTLTCSREMLELWNIDPEEFSNQRLTMQSKVHPEDIEKMNTAIETAISNHSIYEMKYRILPSPGVEKWVASRGRCSYQEDSSLPDRFSGIVYDITESVHAEALLKESKDAAEKANLAKSQFLANMSHEIRTPIGAIMGFTEMLKNETLSLKDKSNFMSIIERNSQNLLRLIDDILDLSKIEAGKIPIEKASFDLSQFLSDFLSVMKLKASEKSIHFNFRAEGLIPDRIVTDQLRLRQILSNLAGNAIKFTEKGSVELVVSYSEPYIHFKVTDTGPGIDSASTGELFQSFGQVDPSLTRKHGGSGLGLTLAKRLSQVLGGDVQLLSSQVNKGSTFTSFIQVELPKDATLLGLQGQASQNKSLSSRGKEPRSPLSHLRVLLVEDAVDNRTLISIYLRNTGAELEMAVDGISGYDKAMELNPDVVLMDIQMPHLDGHAATQKLRKAGFSKPIVALTAHAMREERDKCFQSGCTDYLTKPISRNTLIDLLSRYVPSAE